MISGYKIKVNFEEKNWITNLHHFTTLKDLIPSKMVFCFSILYEFCLRTWSYELWGYFWICIVMEIEKLVHTDVKLCCHIFISIWVTTVYWREFEGAVINNNALITSSLSRENDGNRFDRRIKCWEIVFFGFFSKMALPIF